MDQIALYAQMMDWILKVLLPVLGIVSTVAIYLHMNSKSNMASKADKKTVDDKIKDIENKISKKVDLNAYKTKMESVDSKISTIESTASEDRLIFLNEVKELRKDLRLKKDKP